MQVMWGYLLLSLLALNYNIISGGPLTKWFKTDNNTYYIEAQEKFTWQQSYNECQKKSMDLITVKDYQEDELLVQYITQSFDPKPQFWLKASDSFDPKNMNKLLDFMFATKYLDIKLDGVNEAQILQSNNPDNCAINVNGTVKACDTLHGFICHKSTNQSNNNNARNVQNIVFKLN